MTRCIRLLVTTCAILFFSQSFADWRPTFVDNFEGNRLDLSAWVPGRETLPRRLQFYDEEAIEVRDGVLRLRMLDRPQSDRPYTTAAITTQGLFQQRYGYFEMRARIPSGNGYWPAFWLMPESGIWTSEIDIAEFRGHLPDSVHYAFHYGRRLRNENGLTAQLPTDASTGFNNYAVRWGPQRIDYLFNGEVMHSVVGEELAANASDEMFMILNFALSSAHTNWIPVVNAQTDLNGAFEVDYVRVFEETEDGPFETIPSADTPISNTIDRSQDGTAVSVRRLDEASSIKRDDSPISGTLELTPHSPEVDANVSVVLVQLSDFDPNSGRYNKSSSIETRNYRLQPGSDPQVVNYTFATIPTEPSVYSVDVLIRDPANRNKKSLANYDTIQYVDPAQPGTTIYLQGFFRDGVATLEDGTVRATLPLQLQQALLTPYLNLTYRLVDINTEEELLREEQTFEHTYVGLTPLEPELATDIDPARSVALHIDVTDSSGRIAIPSYALHLEGTTQPPPGWQPGATTSPPRPPSGGAIPVQNWRATFVDNFDGDALNANSWIPNRDQVARRINQYHSDAVQVEGGLLQLLALNRAESDRPYTTGAISSQGLFKQQYGYFELRARVPSGNGFWPAFWLMPESGRWTSEIDIAEFRGHLPDTVHNAFHYGQRLRNEHGATIALGADASSAFNNYAVYWTPERIDYLFNNVIVHSVIGEAAVANAESQMYMILNLALSSTHASGWIPTVDAETNLNQAFAVDYVRVFAADPNGPFVGIPPTDAVIADVAGQAYDATALSVERIRLQGESDIIRAPGPISGRLSLTAHDDDYDGVVSVILVPIIEFNEADGRYIKGTPVASRNYSVALTAAGDTQSIDYYFTPELTAPTAYVVDVLVRDAETNNRRGFSAHRTVQYVDPSLPSRAVFFDGFFRRAVSNLENGAVTGVAELQLQQAMLTPYLTVTYQISRDGQPVATQTETVEHEAVGLIRLTPDIPVAGLDTEQNHQVTVNVSDASGERQLANITMPLGGVGTTPIGTLPPPQSGSTIPTQPAPQPPAPPPPAMDVLEGVSLDMTNNTLAVGLGLQLANATATDTLIYNVKIIGVDGEVRHKFTGSAANTPGGISFTREVAQPLEPGPYQVVVFVFRNTWNTVDRLIFQRVQATAR